MIFQISGSVSAFAKLFSKAHEAVKSGAARDFQ